MTSSHRRGIGYWLTMLLATVLGLIGLVLLAGGVYLIVLGGSPYYAVAGALLILTSILMFRGEQVAIWVYVMAFVMTIIWALSESGFNGWAQVPRLLGPTIMLVLLLLTNPVLRAIRPFNWSGPRMPRSAVAGLMTLLGVGLIVPLALHHTPASAQDARVTAGLPIAIDTAAKTASDDWPVYGGSNLALRYSSLDEITPENVGKLTKVWEYRTGDLPETQPHPELLKDKYSPETTPIKVGNMLYLCSARNIIIAVEAGSGHEDWRYDPQVSDGHLPYGATCRGVSYYSVPNAQPGQSCANRIVEGTQDARLIEVDAGTGKLCDDFGDHGNVDLLKGIGATVPGWYGSNVAPTIVRNVIVMGAQVQDGMDEDAPSGVIRGYDAVTGKFLWAWDMGRADGSTAEPGPNETYTRGTPNMWTAAAGDDELGLVYVPLGNSSVDYFGGNRKDYENTYNSSVVALDVTTGKVVWHFQTVHYDVWDYDLGSQPSLIDFPSDGGSIPALVLPSKQGQIYVLDRRTGKPLTPVDERPVPKSGSVEPDKLSPTQPFSGYNSLVEPDLKESDMWGATLIDQLFCRIQFRQANYFGPYTAPSVDKPFIEYPSYNGGSDWGSVAVDEKSGILIANYNDMPNYDEMITRDEAQQRGWKAIDELGGPDTGSEEGAVQKGAPFANIINAGWKVPWTGLLCKQPPYGGIRAVDLKTGKTLWDHPLGDARNNGPFGLPSYLPILIGTPNNGGPLITAGGLVFVAATTDDMFRAFDIKTGKEVWSTQLPAGGQANPIAFKIDGKQVIAVFAGGHHFMKTKVGDYLEAFAVAD